MTKRQPRINRYRIITAITILAASLLLSFAANSLAATPEIETVFVRGGCFPMGDTFRAGKDYEQPVHEVCVSDFFIGKYEVTQEQWEAVMGSNPSKFPGGRMPVDTVSWDDTQTFIAKLNQMTGKRYRLPTEAEWEYAARSGGKKENWAGTSDESQVGEYAWYKANAGEKTHAVGTKRPNGLGLFDMSGNTALPFRENVMVGLTHNEDGSPIIRVPRALKVGIGIPRGKALRVFIHPTDRQTPWYLGEGYYDGKSMKERWHKFADRHACEAKYVELRDRDKPRAPDCTYPRKLKFFTFSKPMVTDKGAEAHNQT